MYFRVSSVLWDVMVVKKFMCNNVREEGGETISSSQSRREDLAEEKGVCG